MPNFWDCQNCLQPFTARELYPVQFIDVDLKLHRIMLCRDCLAEKDDLDVDYQDEFSDLEIERLR